MPDTYADIDVHTYSPYRDIFDIEDDTCIVCDGSKDSPAHGSHS